MLCVLTLKAPEKKHLKMLSAQVVRCIYLLKLLAKASVEANSVNPDQTVPTD